jgi:hypothetical protein
LAPREPYAPHYRASPRYLERINVPPPYRWRHSPGHVPTGPVMYGNQGVPNAVTVVSRDVLERRQPVSRAVVDLRGGAARPPAPQPVTVVAPPPAPPTRRAPGLERPNLPPHVGASRDGRPEEATRPRPGIPAAPDLPATPGARQPLPPSEAVKVFPRPAVPPPRWQRPEREVQAPPRRGDSPREIIDLRRPSPPQERVPAHGPTPAPQAAPVMRVPPANAPAAQPARPAPQRPVGPRSDAPARAPIPAAAPTQAPAPGAAPVRPAPPAAAAKPLPSERSRDDERKRIPEARERARENLR